MNKIKSEEIIKKINKIIIDFDLKFEQYSKFKDNKSKSIIMNEIEAIMQNTKNFIYNDIELCAFLINEDTKNFESNGYDIPIRFEGSFNLDNFKNDMLEIIDELKMII